MSAADDNPQRPAPGVSNAVPPPPSPLSGTPLPPPDVGSPRVTAPSGLPVIQSADPADVERRPSVPAAPGAAPAASQRPTESMPIDAAPAPTTALPHTSAQPAPPLRPYQTAPERTNRAAVLLGILAVLAIAGGVIGFLLVNGRTDDTTPSSPSAADTRAVEPAAPSPSPSPSPSPTAASSDPSEPVATPDTTTAPIETTAAADTSAPSVDTSAPEPTAPADPQATLDAALATGTAYADTNLIGTWVPQISSKKVGTKADGKVYQLADIADLHADLSAEYGSILIYSNDYVYKSKGLYVEIVPLSFPDPQGALDWCAANGFDRNNCYAKLLTHDESIENTAKYLP